MKTIQQLQEGKKTGLIPGVYTDIDAVSLKVYLNGWRLARSNQKRVFNRSLTSFRRSTGAEICAQYSNAVHTRINLRGVK